jgi:16S rRNA (cytidine1402-2'-O)-methyltransferase
MMSKSRLKKQPISSEESSGTLYVVATPIGNLEDINPRALRTLQEVERVVAEDTRYTSKLLRHFQIETPLTSFHEHSPQAKIDSLIERLKNGADLALVTDSGTPGISDPGANLVAQAHRNQIPVVPVPGASAVVAALSVSGFWAQRFRFEGFPPRKEGERRRFFERLLEYDAPIVLYESPFRVLKTLQTVLEVLGDRPVTICRELTKQFEEVFHGTLSEAIAHWQAKEPRGEFTIVIGADF